MCPERIRHDEPHLASELSMNRKRRLLFALVLALIVGIPTLAVARTPTGRHISGIVQKTNGQTRETEILRTDTGLPLSFVWNNRTTFVANMQVVDAAILKSGARVEVILHQPFFWPAFRYQSYAAFKI